MEGKIKEELVDKDYSQPSTTERRKSSATGKEHKSPEQEESRSSPTPGPASPHHNGTAALSSTESLSPPPEGARAAPLLRLRRFLSALQQFAADGSADTGERVRTLIHNLVAGSVSIEEFQCGVQESTNYPLRASVPGFLRALLPLAQRDLTQRAKRAKLTALQYIRSHEHLILESGGDGSDIFQHPAEAAMKRRASDPFYEPPTTNGAHEEYGPAAKRPPALYLNPSPFLYPGGAPGLFEYGHYHGYHPEPSFERRDGGISVRDVSSMNASLGEPRAPPGPPGSMMKTDDEWRNINTMLNCILSMVEKTKRALAILQQRGCPSSVEPAESSDIKRAASEIMAQAVRQTEERVAEVRRRAEDAVNQVKRQALLELQRAVGAAECKALELVAERGKRPSPPPPAPPPPRDLSPSAAQQQQNCCWNCGRKAQETCSGCGAARYCGAFCQHKDWEHHHQVCSGRDQKPTALLRTSPPSTVSKVLPRATTPITATATSSAPVTTTTERMLPTERLPLPTERLLTQDRSLNTERMTLATLSSAQGMIGIGKK